MKRNHLLAVGLATGVVSVAAAASIGPWRPAADAQVFPQVSQAAVASTPISAPHAAMAFRTESPTLPPRSEAPAVAAARVVVPDLPIAVPPFPLAMATEVKEEKTEVSLPLSPPPPPAPPVISLTAKVDLARQRLTVIENGTVKYTWVISSGAKGYDTPRGLFQPQWMAKDWYSRKYDNAPMPHSVFFKDGAAIHATMNTGTLGIPASHGCVRLSKPNAATFFAMVQRHGMKHTRIHVFGSPRHAPDAVAARSARPEAARNTSRHVPAAYVAAQHARPAYAATFAPSSAVYRPAPARIVYVNQHRRY